MFAFAKPQDHPGYRLWLTSKYRAIAGREEDDDAAIESQVREEHDDWDDDQVKAEVEKRKAAQPPPDDDDDDDDDDVDDADGSKALREELEKSKTELRAAQQTIANAKRELREARKKQAKDSGNWEALAKERESELQDANERLQAAERERDEAKSSLDSFQREVRVTRIATVIGYRDPGDAIALLSAEDTTDDKTAERALRKLAERKKYLVDERKATGRSLRGGDGSNGLLTKDQMDKMTSQEITDNWELVQKSMTALGSPNTG